MKKNALLILILTLPWLPAAPQANSNPLSKIVITSKRATCQKDPANPQFFIFNYQENVIVTFADKSTVTAHSLEVVFEGKDLGKNLTGQHKKAAPSPQPALAPTKQNSMDKFKKIIFSGNVIFNNQNRTATAQKAELCLAEHLCTLSGNVTIKQKKTAPKEIPIDIESDQATLNLQTDELTFSGSMSKPVNTTISLEDYEPLQKKTAKSKHKKNLP